MIRTGAWGDGFGADPDGWTLAKVAAQPHGVDLGALEPRVPEVLATPSGKVALAPEPVIADLDRLWNWLQAPEPEMVLVGRRELRSNNSWLHNVSVLVKGKHRCTLELNPEDAARRGIDDGALATVTSKVGSIELPVSLTESIRPGVVSIPYGWGHDMPGTRLSIASERPGVNTNLLTDPDPIDPLSETLCSTASRLR